MHLPRVGHTKTSCNVLQALVGRRLGGGGARAQR